MEKFPKSENQEKSPKKKITRREMLKTIAIGGGLTLASLASGMIGKKIMDNLEKNAKEKTMKSLQNAEETYKKK